MRQGISIIICGYNSATRIEPVLSALQAQKFTDSKILWEVIFVDNASTDASDQVVREHWAKNPVTDLKIVKELRSGLSYARHKGIETAQYDIVSFIDDDNWVEEWWVQKVNDIFRNDAQVGACGGRNIGVFEKERPGWFPYFENNFAVGQQSNESGYVDETKGFLWGAGLSFRRSLWIELKRRGFSILTVDRQGENLTSGGDTELCYAFRLLGSRLYYKSDLQLSHFMPESRMNFSYLEKMCGGFGRSFALLNSYRALLYPGKFKLHSWPYEWLAAKKKIIQLQTQLFFARKEHQKWRIRTETAYWKGYAKAVWQGRGNLQKNISLLKSVFTA